MGYDVSSESFDFEGVENLNLKRKNTDSSCVDEALDDRGFSNDTSLASGGEDSGYNKVIRAVKQASKKSVAATVAAFKAANKAGVFSTLGNYIIKPAAGGMGFGGTLALFSRFFAGSAGRATGNAVNTVASSENGKKFFSVVNNTNSLLGGINKSGILKDIQNITQICRRVKRYMLT